ncbi:transposase [Candidatus Vondammii sp. HM_W22]|uniref:transposase n=1 Tax=Candidatus Vondammii sp. HM_W22 TaxID=2687299 RepID=UPI001F144B27|nr:transposase [Candidatus Vondammii sp. HM_W22]
MGVDETAFKKRHDYAAVLSDQDAGTVLHMGSDRKKAMLKAHGTKVWQRSSEKR